MNEGKLNAMMAIHFTVILGFVAGVFTAVAMLPQLIKTYREKRAEDVSLVMLLILLSGISLWIAYGIVKADWPIIITNSISLLINIVLVYFRQRYKK